MAACKGHEAMLEEGLQAVGVSVSSRSVVQETGVWRRRMNHELTVSYVESSIRRIAKAGRIRWTGLVARMLDNVFEYFAFATYPVGSKRRDHVEHDLASHSRVWKGKGEMQIVPSLLLHTGL